MKAMFFSLAYLFSGAADGARLSMLVAKAEAPPAPCHSRDTPMV